MENPSVLAYAALVATSLSIGYWAGSRARPNQTLEGDAHAEEKEADIEDDCKMALVVRSDLGMSTGKIAAQCSHASLACYKALLDTNPTILRQWERSGQTKVALRCSSEAELLALQTQAQSLNLCARSIRDAGRTQIAAGSRTVLGITGRNPEFKALAFNAEASTYIEGLQDWLIGLQVNYDCFRERK